VNASLISKSGIASDSNVAAMPADNAMSNPEAESGAEIFFCGVKGIEDFADRFGRNAKAGVHHTDSHSRTMTVLPGKSGTIFMTFLP
jgi:hypothetical protein